MSLRAKIQMEDNFEESEGRMAKFAEHFEHHFLRHLSKTVGSIALASGIFKFVESIFGKPEEIEKASLKFKMTTDEVQLLTEAAKEMGLTFEEYLAKAEKGTVSLVDALNEARSKATTVISTEDIKTLTEDTKLLKDLWEGLVNASIRGTAHAIRAAGDPNVFKGIGLGPKGAMARAVIQERLPEELGAPDPFDLANLPLFGFSEGVSNMERRKQLNEQIRELKKEMIGIRPRQLELIAPELTARQQVGAYSGGTGTVAEKIDETNNILHQMQDELKTLENDLANLMATGG